MILPVPDGTYRMVRTGPLADQYTDSLLPGSIVDLGCFRPVTTRNRTMTVDFDHRRLLWGDISRGRKKGEEKGEPRDPAPLSLDDLNPSSDATDEMSPPPRLRRRGLSVVGDFSSSTREEASTMLYGQGSYRRGFARRRNETS